MTGGLIGTSSPSTPPPVSQHPHHPFIIHRRAYPRAGGVGNRGGERLRLDLALMFRGEVGGSRGWSMVI
eukprot:754953-Hanusia_phi.AAC.1